MRVTSALTCSATVTAGGLPPYQYEYRLYEASTSTWATVREYGPNGVLSWTPPHTGDFQLELRVRSAGTTAAYEAHVVSGVFRVQPAGATDVLGSGQGLYPGQGVFSTDGRFGLIYQGDGNLVLYAPNGVPLWWTGVVGPPGVTMMQTDGDLVILSNGTVGWHTGTAGHPGAYMRVQSDGNLVMCSASGSVLMSTGRGGQEPEAAAATPQTDTLALAATNPSGPGGPVGGGRGAPSGLERHAPGRRTVKLAISGLALVSLLIAAGLLVAVTRLRRARVKARQPQLHSQRRVGGWRMATLFGTALVANALAPAAVAGQTEILEYYHLDTLGSVRVVTDQSGQIVKDSQGREVGRHDFLPFGEEWPAATTTEEALHRPGTRPGDPSAGENRTLPGFRPPWRQTNLNPGIRSSRLHHPAGCPLVTMIGMPRNREGRAGPCRQPVPCWQ